MSQATERRLDLIAEKLGITRDQLVPMEQEIVESPNFIIDGAPFDFEAWAAQTSDVRTQDILKKIAEILIQSKKARSHP